MASSASGYGAYNPSGVDPFQIEQALAQIVGTNNPAEAGNLLDVYRVQNQTASANYDYALNQQHDFARQQLEATIADNAMKHALDAVKTRGGVSVAAAMDPSIRARISQLIPAIEGGLDAEQRADIASKGATGVLHSVQAGFVPSGEEATRISGIHAPEGTPLALREIAARESAAAGRAVKEQDLAVSLQGAPQPGFGNAPATIGVPKGWTMEQAAARAKAKGLVVGTPVRVPPGGAQPAQPGQTSAPPAPRGRG